MHYYKIQFLTDHLSSDSIVVSYTMYLTADDEAHARQRAIQHHVQFMHDSNPKMTIVSFVPEWEKTTEPA